MTTDRNGRPGPDHRHGLPDHHDPTAGFGGAAPARSALTLRAVLAAFGLVFCVGAAWFAFAGQFPEGPDDPAYAACFQMHPSTAFTPQHVLDEWHAHGGRVLS